jgi:hypothetical protein
MLSKSSALSVISLLSEDFRHKFTIFLCKASGNRIEVFDFSLVYVFGFYLFSVNKIHNVDFARVIPDLIK